MKRKYIYREFDNNLQKILKEENVFFFYGSNNYSMLETINKINISNEFIYCWEADIKEVFKKLTTLDLFNPKIKVVLRYFDKATKTFRKDIFEFLQKYKFSNYLFILYEKDLLLKERDEIINYLIENFISVEYPQPTKEEVIENFIPKKINFELPYEVKEMLWENTNDLWLLSNELEKLSYFINDKKNKISKEEINECCNEYDMPEIKDLIEAIINNSIYQKIGVINQLVVNNYTALGVINSLYRYFRKHFLFKKISTQKAYKILKEIQYADYKIKTSSNSKYVVENCILKITQIYNDLL
ncbi:MAG: hypothetical protein N2505_00680 [Endomicrobia bacterium]|nr:hypothetical protein [Endomicrobiia bacterium]